MVDVNVTGCFRHRRGVHLITASVRIEDRTSYSVCRTRAIYPAVNEIRQVLFCSSGQDMYVSARVQTGTGKLIVCWGTEFFWR